MDEDRNPATIVNNITSRNTPISSSNSYDHDDMAVTSFNNSNNCCASKSVGEMAVDQAVEYSIDIDSEESDLDGIESGKKNDKSNKVKKKRRRKNKTSKDERLQKQVSAAEALLDAQEETKRQKMRRISYVSTISNDSAIGSVTDLVNSSVNDLGIDNIEENNEKSSELTSQNQVLDKNHAEKHVPSYLWTKLRPHQKEGVTFLFDRVVKNREGALLADHMGLGKTLQVICLITACLALDKRVSRQRQPHGPKNEKLITKHPPSTLDSLTSTLDSLTQQKRNGILQEQSPPDESLSTKEFERYERCDEKSLRAAAAGNDNENALDNYDTMLSKRVLIVAPSIVVSNWELEIQKWLTKEDLQKIKVINLNRRFRQKNGSIKERVKRLREWRADTRTHMITLISYELYVRLVSVNTLLPEEKINLQKAEKMQKYRDGILKSAAASTTFGSKSHTNDLRSVTPPLVLEGEDQDEDDIVFVIDDSDNDSDITDEQNTVSAKSTDKTMQVIEEEEGVEDENKENSDVQQQRSVSLGKEEGSEVEIESDVEIRHKGKEEPLDVQLLRMARGFLWEDPTMIIVDEGHRLKRESTQVSRSLRRVETMRRIILTGYPLQNHVAEYYHMIDFCRPGTLGDKKLFRKLFLEPIRAGQCKDSSAKLKAIARGQTLQLRKRAAPYVLRRGLEVLASALPSVGRSEYILHLRASNVQKKLYLAYCRKNLARIRHRQVSETNFGRVSLPEAYHIAILLGNHPTLLGQQKNVLESKQKKLGWKLWEQLRAHERSGDGRDILGFAEFQMVFPTTLAHKSPLAQHDSSNGDSSPLAQHDSSPLAQHDYSLDSASILTDLPFFYARQAQLHAALVEFNARPPIDEQTLRQRRRKAARRKRQLERKAIDERKKRELEEKMKMMKDERKATVVGSDDKGKLENGIGGEGSVTVPSGSVTVPSGQPKPSSEEESSDEIILLDENGNELETITEPLSSSSATETSTNSPIVEILSNHQRIPKPDPHSPCFSFRYYRDGIFTQDCLDRKVNLRVEDQYDQLAVDGDMNNENHEKLGILPPSNASLQLDLFALKMRDLQVALPARKYGDRRRVRAAKKKVRDMIQQFGEANFRNFIDEETFKLVCPPKWGVTVRQVIFYDNYHKAWWAAPMVSSIDAKSILGSTKGREKLYIGDILLWIDDKCLCEVIKEGASGYARETDNVQAVIVRNANKVIEGMGAILRAWKQGCTDYVAGQGDKDDQQAMSRLTVARCPAISKYTSKTGDQLIYIYVYILRKTV